MNNSNLVDAQKECLVVFKYTDFRKYLKDFYDHSKQTKKGFSFRSFAESSGLSSTSHMRLVMTGQRGLGNRSLVKFCRGLKLNSLEAEYFQNLVSFNQCSDQQEKFKYLKQLEKTRRKAQKSRRLNQNEESSLYEEWFYPLVYQMVQIEGLSHDSKVLAKRIKTLSSSQIEMALTSLTSSNLLVKDPKTQQFKITNKSLKSSDEIENLKVRNFQRKMYEMAVKSFDLPISQREIQSLTIAADLVGFQNLKQKIKQFLEEANVELSQSCQSKESVYQLNIQLFEVD